MDTILIEKRIAEIQKQLSTPLTPKEVENLLDEKYNLEKSLYMPIPRTDKDLLIEYMGWKEVRNPLGGRTVDCGKQIVDYDMIDFENKGDYAFMLMDELINSGNAIEVLNRKVWINDINYGEYVNTIQKCIYSACLEFIKTLQNK